MMSEISKENSIERNIYKVAQKEFNSICIYRVSRTKAYFFNGLVNILFHFTHMLAFLSVRRALVYSKTIEWEYLNAEGK